MLLDEGEVDWTKSGSGSWEAVNGGTQEALGYRDMLAKVTRILRALGVLHLCD